MIHDSLWVSECPLRECRLGIDLGGHQRRGPIPRGNCAGCDHLTRVLSWNQTWEGIDMYWEILKTREVLVDELENGSIEVGLMPTDL